MGRWLGAVVFGLLLGAAGSAWAVRAPPPPPPPERESVGRWQIVHGAPEAVFQDFLIDTVTGESYLRCSDGSSVVWCQMPRSSTPPAAPASASNVR
jgi:hypothetical protein